MYTNSEELFKKSSEYIPGGVNSPVRAFKQVGGSPVFMHAAKGAYLFDEDGNKYIDYICSWGPMILGHQHPDVVAGLKKQLRVGISYGAPTAAEYEMAKLICENVPNVELVRFCSSGTEACMSAIRVARGFTKRAKILKFNGHYHGHADSFLKKAGSGVATLGIQVVDGVTEGVLRDTLVAEYNNIESVREIVEAHHADLACIIVEPVAGNMGCIVPTIEFLTYIREVCNQYGIIFIADEVMTGFRLSFGGAQQMLGFNADMVTMGKILGGGLPVGAFGGKKEIMERVAPLGNVYQAGTLSGNPLAMTAGSVTLKTLLAHPEIYDIVNKTTADLANGLRKVFSEENIPHTVNQIGSMISVHFGEFAVVDFPTAAACDLERFKRYFHFMLNNGVYLPPSPFESWFLSYKHSKKDIARTLELSHAFARQETSFY